VYKAIQQASARLAALKVLASGMYSSPNARRRFEREVELASALEHPGIVRVIEGGWSEGVPYYVMEYVEGQGLERFLARHPLAEKLRLFILIAEAIHYAHLRAVVHRDLKPANIMVDSSDRPRILCSMAPWTSICSISSLR